MSIITCLVFLPPFEENRINILVTILQRGNHVSVVLPKVELALQASV